MTEFFESRKRIEKRLEIILGKMSNQLYKTESQTVQNAIVEKRKYEGPKEKMG